MDTSSLPDLDSTDRIRNFVDAFYARVLRDERLRPIFLDVAEVDLAVHLPHIRSYWEKLLLGDKSYQRHTMNIHRDLHQKKPLSKADFERWLALFTLTVDANYCGPGAERAKRLAGQIATNMRGAITSAPSA